MNAEDSKVKELQTINPSLTQERRDAILASCRAWFADYNATAKPDYRLTSDMGIEIAAQCLRADADPGEESIRAYPKRGKLIFMLSIQTLVGRAERTGRFVSHKTYTRIREDKRLMAVAEIAHLWLPPAGVNVAPIVAVSSEEGDVEQFKAQFAGSGGDTPWGKNPTDMTGVTLLRHLLVRRFPEILGGSQDAEPADFLSDDDGQAAPTPAQQSAAREAATSPAGATPAQAVGAARAALNGEKQKAREPAPAAEAPAPAPAAEPPAQAPAAQLEAVPAPQGAAPQAAPSDRHADLIECAPGGFGVGDLEELAQGGFRCAVADLSDAQLTQLRAEILPRGPVTVAVRAEVVARREAFLAAGGDAAGWLAHCRAVARPDFRWHPTWLWSDDAQKILAAQAPAGAA